MTAAEPKATVDALLARAQESAAAGDFGAAKRLCAEILEDRPHDAGARRVLGDILRRQGQNKEAITAYRSALDEEPHHFDALTALGKLLYDERAFKDACIAFQQALALKPRDSDVRLDLAASLDAIGEINEAAELCRSVLQADPHDVRALVAVGDYLCKRGKFEDAIAYLENAIEIAAKESPNLVHGYTNMAKILELQGDAAGALDLYDKAIAIQSDYPQARTNRGLLLLRNGDFKRGWIDHEFRFKTTAYARSGGVYEFDRPRWQGESLSGKVIFVHSEHWLGDTIHFARYVPLLVDQARHVIFDCHAEAWRLLSAYAAEGIELRPRSDDDRAHPSFDVHCPLLSLPAYLGVTARRNLSPKSPYLKVGPDLTGPWTARVPVGGLKVGLAWAGTPRTVQDRNRSIQLQELAPLLAVPGVEWISLQKGPGREQIAGLAATSKLHDFDDLLSDFADMAALMMHLDLVIAADTSVAHLAGALGKRVWTLLPSVPDWRWMNEGEETHWYPSMRLFRQERTGVWSPAVTRVIQELKTLIEQRL